MKLKQSAVLNSVVAGAAISMAEAGFLPNMQVVAILASPAAAFVGSAIVQTSVDGTTWTTAPGATAVTAGGVSIQAVTVAQFVRLNMTAFTSGSLQLTLLSDID